MKTNKMCAIVSNEHEYTELRDLTKNRSLSALYFGGKYRIMDFPLSCLVNANIRDIYTLINEGKAKSYLDHLGGGKEWGLDTIGSYQYLDFFQNILQKKVSGNNYYDEMIKFIETSEAPYTVYCGDKMICNVDLRSALRYHQSTDSHITAIFKRVGNSEVAPDDQVFELDDKNHVLSYTRGIDRDTTLETQNLSMGIYVIDSDWLIKKLRKAEHSGASVEFIEGMAKLIAGDHGIAYEYTGYLSNVFDVPSYFKANMDMLDKSKMDSLLNGSQQIITRVKNEVGTFYSENSKVTNSLLSTGCRVYGSVDHSVVSRRSNIGRNAVVKNSLVMANADVQEGASVEYAILDKDVTVDSGVTIRGTEDKPVIVTKGTVVTTDIIERG